MLTQAPPQLVRPPEQVVTQAPFEHTWFIMQALPHDDIWSGPQLSGSERVSMQVEPQRKVPLGHAQAPALQMRPPVQVVPQAPQLAASVWVFTHTLPQAVCPVGHESTHDPP